MAGTARDLTGQVIVITGASSGIGLAGAKALASRGAGVVLVGRDRERLKAAADEVAVLAGFPPLTHTADFSRLDDVHLLADQLRQRLRRIHVLVSNAGAVRLSKKKTTTRDGHETTVQVNHLGGFLLANLLREQLRGGRIVVTSSDVHSKHAIDPADLSAKTGWAGYGASKSANILFALEAARRWPDIVPVSFHPGVVSSRFGTGTLIKAGQFFIKPFLLTPEKGADTMVHLVTAPTTELQRGGYYVKRTLTRPAPHAADPATAARLWDASLAAVGIGWQRH
ncbi:SDR family NAD(P)-dependent oxidoreductase [Virgisporangium aliadipatigenens]|uniref:SDR family NAD(P)-dependent oxidoreductase n=1 Tax=Virgisporangium aliadipatigenens TaxID=741659 RepID=UPI001EF210CA|nr:SDR family NAD(P)-dependent oxidoreductase [Virgisporangium aliadipatigenens]